jgi:hypothetical protein
MTYYEFFKHNTNFLSKICFDSYTKTNMSHWCDLNHQMSFWTNNKKPQCQSMYMCILVIYNHIFTIHPRKIILLLFQINDYKGYECMILNNFIN